MKYILNYNDAQKIVKEYSNFNFSETLFNVEDFKVSVFNYFLCEYKHFNLPLIKQPHINAFDMRGTTFIFNKFGHLHSTWFMLPKFFNLNQVESTQYDVVKDKKIVSISTKEDGSLIGFMKLPNGNVFCKTIGGIGNEQSLEAFKIYSKDRKLQKFIHNCLNNNYTPLFEYVSFNNRIVLQYSKPQLRFLGIRHNVGDYEYISNAKLQIKNIDHAAIIKDKTLDDLIKEGEKIENFEGWVVEFEDGQIIKVKVPWYFDKHRLRTCDVFREDYIIKHYLEGTIDDIICQLDKKNDSDAINFIEYVKKSVNNWSIKIDNDVKELLKEYKGDIKDFAIKHHKDYVFRFCMHQIKDGDYTKFKIEYMLKKTYRLQEARFFVEKFKN